MNDMTDKDIQLEERLKRNEMLYPKVDVVDEYIQKQKEIEGLNKQADIDLKLQKLASKNAKLSKGLEAANSDEYNPINLDPSTAKNINEIKQESKRTDDLLKEQSKASDILSRTLSKLNTEKGNTRENVKKAMDEQRNLDAIKLMLQGAEQAGAAFAGGSLTQIKPNYSGSEMISQIANRNVQQAQDLAKTRTSDIAQEKQDAILNLKLKSDAIKSQRQEEIDALNKQYKEAQIAKLLGTTSNNLSSDPTSEASKKAQDKLKKAGYAEDLSGFSEAEIAKNLTGFLRKTTPKLQLEREKRLKEKQAWQIGEKDEISDKQLESINTINELQVRLDKIKELRKVVSPGYYSQKMHEAGKYSPFDLQDTNRAALTQLTGRNLADYVKSISGAAVSEQEAQRLAKNIPTPEDKPSVFDRKLKEFEKELKDTLKIRMVNMEGYQGKMVDKASSGAVAPYGDTVERNGKKYKWNPTVGKYQLL